MAIPTAYETSPVFYYHIPTPPSSITHRFAGRVPTPGEILVLREELYYQLRNVPDMELLVMYYDTLVLEDDIIIRPWQRDFIEDLFYCLWVEMLDLRYTEDELIRNLEPDS